jgi:crotonobetainyl-CoA:carnitine CoA-transferase CaiB-like acyl-CoA transferase
MAGVGGARPEAWARLGALPEAAALPETFAPLRGGPHDSAAGEAETVLEAAFAGAGAAVWVARLRALGLPTEQVRAVDRDRFRQGILDDPVNRQLGRVAAYQTADWGHFEQIGPLLRCGPEPAGGPDLMLPGVGEHTTAVLSDLGFSRAEIDALLATKVVRQG